MVQLLDGHVVLVTGGGSGLGLGVARHCLSEGAQLAILEYDPTKVVALKEEFGDEVLVTEGDVRNLEHLQACRAAIVQRYGRLTSLIGTQGIWDGNVGGRHSARTAQHAVRCLECEPVTFTGRRGGRRGGHVLRRSASVEDGPDAELEVRDSNCVTATA